MSLQLGETAPDFTLDSTQGSIHLSDYVRGHWVVFFSHPKDFTPVCTTELGAFARRKAEFDQRKTKLLGLSVDPVGEHNKWVKDVADVGGAPVTYPIVADPDLKVAKLYGMFHPKADALVTVRSVFFIDPKQVVRTVLTYPPSVGRSVDEILQMVRVVAGLVGVAGKGVALADEFARGSYSIWSGVAPSVTITRSGASAWMFCAISRELSK